MFAMDGGDDDQEFLSLSLGVISTEYCSPTKGHKRKRSREEVIVEWDLNDSSDGKIFNLLEMRDQMLKQEKTCGGSVSSSSTTTGGCGGSVENGKGLHLIHSLLISATSVDGNDKNSSIDNLCELYQNITLFGDSLQRVAAYFADGLVARLLTRKSPFYDVIMKNPTHDEEFMAFTQFYKVSPLYQFAHFTANQSIIEAFEKDQEDVDDYNNNHRYPSIHVIDFDVSYGFQWPSLIQSLSEISNAGSRISIKITGFGRSKQELQETEKRLVSFAKGFRNLEFKFEGLLRGGGGVILSNLKRKKNETLVVNLVFHLNTLNSNSYNNPKVSSETLRLVQLLNPSLVVMAEQDGSRSQQKFLPRFMESLHYFAAMFDSLDDCLPTDSTERSCIEKHHLGREIKNVMNFDKHDHDRDRLDNNNVSVTTTTTKSERMGGTWKERMEGYGFKGSKLSSKSFIQARLLLKIRSHCSPVQIDGENGGFRILEKDDGKAISLGWQDRCLVTVSAWKSVGILSTN